MNTQSKVLGGSWLSGRQDPMTLRLRDLGRQLARSLGFRSSTPVQDQPPANLDTGVFTSVIESGSERARNAMARQLAAVLADRATTELERRLIVPLVKRLAADPEVRIRRGLARRLKSIAGLEEELVFAILADRDDIAVPFLSETPALNPALMLAVLDAGDITRQIAVALRADITEEAQALIVDTAALPVCLALFENTAVRLDEEEYRRFNDRFGETPDVAELLLTRPELPPDIRVQRCRRVSKRLHHLISERGWVAANDADEIVGDSEDMTILRILKESNGAELAHAMPLLISRETLTPLIIVRAACLGEMQVVAQILAYLAGMPIARARERMAGKGFTGFKGLHGRSGLPKSCFGILQAACDVAADEAKQRLSLDGEEFGRRLIEALMTRYEAMPPRDRAQYLDFISRFAENPVRNLAKRLKTDMSKAA